MQNSILNYLLKFPSYLSVPKVVTILSKVGSFCKNSHSCRCGVREKSHVPRDVLLLSAAIRDWLCRGKEAASKILAGSVKTNECVGDNQRGGACNVCNSPLHKRSQQILPSVDVEGITIGGGGFTTPPIDITSKITVHA